MKVLSGRELPDGRILEETGVIRDYVKTDATLPFRAPAIRRHVAQAQEMIRRVRAGAEAACPAARVLGVRTDSGLAVRCAVERSLITEREHPSSLGAFCLNAQGYRDCPTWRLEKERIWAARRLPLVGEQEGGV